VVFTIDQSFQAMLVHRKREYAKISRLMHFGKVAAMPNANVVTMQDLLELDRAELAREEALKQLQAHQLKKVQTRKMAQKTREDLSKQLEASEQHRLEMQKKMDAIKEEQHQRAQEQAAKRMQMQQDLREKQIEAKILLKRLVPQEPTHVKLQKQFQKQVALPQLNEAKQALQDRHVEPGGGPTKEVALWANSNPGLAGHSPGSSPAKSAAPSLSPKIASSPEATYYKSNNSSGSADSSPAAQADSMARYDSGSAAERLVPSRGRGSSSGANPMECSGSTEFPTAVGYWSDSLHSAGKPAIPFSGIAHQAVIFQSSLFLIFAVP